MSLSSTTMKLSPRFLSIVLVTPSGPLGHEFLSFLIASLSSAKFICRSAIFGAGSFLSQCAWMEAFTVDKTVVVILRGYITLSWLYSELVVVIYLPQIAIMIN